MKRSMLCLFVLFLFSAGWSSGAVDSWYPYATKPDTQPAGGDGNYCPKFSTSFCVEIMYNYWYQLGDHKVDLDEDSFPTGTISAVFGNAGSSAQGAGFRPKATADPDTFPNYTYANFRITGYHQLWTQLEYASLSTLQTALTYAPVIIKIKNYVGQTSSTICAQGYTGAIVTHSGAGTDGFHYVVALQYNADLNYLLCMGSLETPNNYLGGGFFRISTANFESSTDRWCEEAYTVSLHDTFNEQYFSSGNLNIKKAAKIFPGVVSSFYDFSDTEHVPWTTGEAVYVNDNVGLSVSSVTIPSYRTVYVEPDVGLTSHSITIGSGQTLALGISSTFTRLGSSGFWTGITVQSGGHFTFGYNDVIEYAKTGIFTESANAIANGNPSAYSSVIQNCRDSGLYIYNASPSITYLKFLDNNYPYPYSSKGIQIAGSSANPFLEKVTINGSKTGLYLDSSAWAKLKNSNLGNSTTVVDNIYISLYAYLNMDGFVGDGFGNLFGHNNIYSGSGYMINNPSAYFIPAGYNYWSPSQNFYAPNRVTYTDTDHTYTSPCSNGAPKPAVTTSTFAATAKDEEDSGDWNAAITIYQNILAMNSDSIVRLGAIKSILHDSAMRCQETKVIDYSEARSVINSELISAKSNYKAVLNYLLCEVSVKEGKYSQAIDAFTAKAAQYTGTSMEVEMLTRVATLYGMYLNNKAKAKEFADKAAAVNPGQECLYIAYRTAGMDYLPWQYTDRFKGVAENFDRNPEQPKPTVETESVSITPNPANPVTTITYSITSPSAVKLSIYSINGQKVATLVDGPVSAGVHAVKFDGSKYASGVYFYRFESAELMKTGKMLLLK